MSITSENTKLLKEIARNHATAIYNEISDITNDDEQATMSGAIVCSAIVSATFLALFINNGADTDCVTDHFTHIHNLLIDMLESIPQ